jgi:hypothetical protein
VFGAVGLYLGGLCLDRHRVAYLTNLQLNLAGGDVFVG